VEIEDLVGKTITAAEQMVLEGYDDIGYFHLTFTDGTECVIEGGYGGYSGKSVDEYQTQINVNEASCYAGTLKPL
jgi:hypothetical protein